MNEKPDMMINIYGGNNQIAPVASSAIQNFYGDQGDEAANQPEDSEKIENTGSMGDAEPMEDTEELTDEEFHLCIYMSNVKVLKSYETYLGECTSAHELAAIVGKMLVDKNCKNIDKSTVVKAAFIRLLLPFARRLTSGATVDNIRAQINNMLASR